MKIKYPYLPEGKEILYVSEDNIFMQEAKKYALSNSLDKTMPTGSVIVKNGEIIGRGANGSDYHLNNSCERVLKNIPTGQGYELCEGCHPKNHSEPKAINKALEKQKDLSDAELYLWGHWWCCEPCWQAIISAGIKKVYLQEGSHVLFDKNQQGNIVGKQFEINKK
jgi:deoxycytidylate deaminase